MGSMRSSAAVSALPAGLSPQSHVPHALHAEHRVWVEKNCAIDVWIELLHAHGLEPRAMLGVTAAMDFLGDQWTFFKPSNEALRSLYGIDVQELTLWRPLQDHVLEHVGAGRLVGVEADAWWLPDTAATDYRRQHTKTTIVIAECDPQAGRLVYFHNAGLYELEGEDYRCTMDNGGLPVPLFAEWTDPRRRVARSDDDLRAECRQRLREHLAWRPADNPVRRFQERFVADQALLRQQGLARYHAWAFANTRQLGAAMELLSEHLLWLRAAPDAAQDFLTVAQGCKTLILKAARAVAGTRDLDGAELFDTMAQAWQRGMARTEQALGSPCGASPS
jgi:hypothetical protein